MIHCGISLLLPASDGICVILMNEFAFALLDDVTLAVFYTWQ